MTYSIETEIRFRDLDALNHVNSSVYFSYMEYARVEYFLRRLGIPSAAELPFILASARAEYRAPAPGSRRLKITLWTSRLGGRSWDFDYRIQDTENDRVYAEGRTVQVAYDYQAASTKPIPDPLRRHLQAIQGTPLQLCRDD